MATNAIFQTPGIIQNSAAQYQGANKNIFDAITAAADMYDKIQMQKQANLTSLRGKQLEVDAQRQQDMLDPQKASLMIAQKYNANPASVTPQDVANYNTAQKMLAAKTGLDQYGRPVSTYSPVPLGAGSPADMMAPAPPTASIPAQGSGVADMLIPPPALDNPNPTPAGYAKATEAPTPLGAQPEKVEKPDYKTMTPLDMEEYKSNLDTQKSEKLASFNAGVEKQKSAFYKPKLQSVLDKMSDINEQLQKAGALKSAEKSGLSNAINMAAGVEIPFIGGKPGRAVEEVASKKVASLRDQYDGLKSNALQLLKNAANIAAGSMNSDKEAELAMRSFGDANGNYEANKNSLQTTMQTYGTKEAESKDSVDQNDPRVQKALKAGYTMEEIKAHLNGGK